MHRNSETPEDFRRKIREWEEGLTHLGISRDGKIRKVREWETYTRHHISFPSHISLRYPISLHFFFPKLCILLCEQTNPFIFLKPKDRVESAALSSPIALHTPPHKLSSTHPFSATQHKHAKFFFFFQFQIFTYILYKKNTKTKTKQNEKIKIKV